MKNKFTYLISTIAVLLILTGCTKLPDNDKLYPIKSNNQYGFIDKNGVEVIKPKYDLVMPSDESLLAVRFQGKWGYINREGTFIIIPQYTKAEPFKDDLAFVSDGKIEGYINKKNEFVWKQKIKLQNHKKTVRPKVKKDLADSILEEVEDVLP